MPGQFIVPQFIDKEDRIIGPITVRQFLICLVSAGIVFVEYKMLTTAFFILAFIPTAGLAGTFAFLKINGQPFHLFFVNFLQSQVRPKLRVWNKSLSLEEIKGAQRVVGLPAVEKPKLKKRPSSTRLRDLALVVNTGGVYQPEEVEQTINNTTNSVK
ncbi:MAG: PrgI family protein [Patescibacteria group bacterium]|nr:PrgI family protein [Patescibacteria group bacterium]